MSWGEILIVLAVGMFVLGPERIPVAVKWVGSTLKTVRTMAAGAQEQLRGEFGPELEELRRQVADLQSLKEIQELRKLRDLNPRSLIQKNLLGEEFSGGLSGLLGLNQAVPNQAVEAAKPTGYGVAPELIVPELIVPEQIVPEQIVPEQIVPEPSALEQFAPEPVAPEPVALDPIAPSPVTAVPEVRVDEPVQLSKPAAPRHAAPPAFDLDAT